MVILIIIYIIAIFGKLEKFFSILLGKIYFLWGCSGSVFGVKNLFKEMKKMF